VRLGQDGAGGVIYVFCARREEQICFSLSDDASAVPAPSDGETWQILFQIPKSVNSIEVFRVNGPAILLALETDGYCVVKPSASVLPFRKVSSDED
jgi:hypothetical protein